MTEISRILNLGPLAFWGGCISGLLFLISIFVGPQNIQGETRLITFILFPTWLKLLPLIGSLLMIVSGYIMMSAEKQASHSLKTLDIGGEHDSGLKGLQP